MYGEIAQAAETTARCSWPLPMFPRHDDPKEVLPLLEHILEGAGWHKTGSSWLLAEHAQDPDLQLHFSLSDWMGDPPQQAHFFAVSLGLGLLARSRLPLRRQIRLGIGFDGDAPADSLIFRPAWSGAGCPGGSLIVPGSTGEGEVIFLPGKALFEQARNALRNAGITPGISVWLKEGLDGLGFLAPGRPDRSLAEMTDAIRAYASLVYGLAGFGVMAFDFDLDF